MTSYSLKPHQIELSFSDTISNGVQSQQESTTTFESELMPKEKLEPIGLKSTKVCRLCKQEKPYSEFHKKRSDLDRHDSRCKQCKKEYVKALNKVKATAPPKPSTCACCNKQTANLVVDHCHESNVFRGWICGPCNTSIGKLGDNVEGVQKALTYLINAFNGN